MRRLYRAICGWIEADTQARGGDPVPEGNNFTQAEHAPGTNRQDLHADANRESLDNDDGGVYRLGFNTQHQGDACF